MFSQREEERLAKGKFCLFIVLILLFLLYPLTLSQGDSLVPQRSQTIPQKEEKPRKRQLSIRVYLPHNLPKEFLDHQKGKLDLSLDFSYDYSEFFEYNQYLTFYRTTRRVPLKSLNLLFSGPARPFAGAPIWDGLFLPVYSLNRDPVLRTFWWDW